MASKDDIIGTGWSFPPQFDYDRATLTLSTGTDDIHESLFIIFTTALGERVMQPKFGCSLDSMLMEPMNTSTLGYIQHLLETAILYHEPRIDAESINLDVESSPGELRIEVVYTVRGTNSRFNQVFPFYLVEGDR